MKITIIQGAFFPVPPIQGGAVEKIWYRMGQEFSNLGHEVIHISKSHPDLIRKEKKLGVTYLRIKGYTTPSSLVKLKWLDLLYSRRAVKKIPKDSDIIITNTFWSPILLRGKTGRKVYVSVERTPKGQMKFYSHTGKLRACSRAIYDAIKNELPSNSHKLVSYVPNPIPFNIKPVSAIREKIILFVGRLHPEKGVHILIQAFLLLQKENFKEWKLTIVGPSETSKGGGGEAYLKNLKEVSTIDNIEFTGPVFNESDLVNYYCKASIFCYPVQNSSGDAAPIAPKEAMVYGCVPVVSQLDCFDDFVIDKINGMRFNQNNPDQVNDLAQSLRILMDNSLLLGKLSTEAKKVLSIYAAPAIANAFIEDFKKLEKHAGS